MPRVRSDEMHADTENGGGNGGDHHDTIVKEKTPSPIGAGLPLLQRLRLLKEKQVSFSFLLFFLFILFSFVYISFVFISSFLIFFFFCSLFS